MGCATGRPLPSLHLLCAQPKHNQNSHANGSNRSSHPISFTLTSPSFHAHLEIMPPIVHPSIVLLFLLSSFATDYVLAERFTINAPLITSKLGTNRTILVDSTGKEDFTSVQKAIDSVPDGNSQWIIIHVRAGVYREKVMIPETKPYIFLRGNGKGRTYIIWDDSSTENTESATFTVQADNFVAFGISFKNEAPMGEADTPYNQSVAAMVAGDKVAFYHCAFYSPHNTLFDYKGRHYYETCYIQGSIDFIFGRGQSLFQSCEIFAISDRRKTIRGSITAQNRQSPDDDSGFIFLHGKVYGVRDVYLGRPKGSHSRVIFAKTYISKTILPEGWTTYSYEGSTENLLYGEFGCSGPGASSVKRVNWARQLMEGEAKPFMSIGFIDGEDWLPVYYQI